ncbi:hypothetical protein QJQ45_010578 [Haematococcus lacustris]|nr:hypothetical protein QJQ45_010578 [Haematococcus lacustris]
MFQTTEYGPDRTPSPRLLGALGLGRKHSPWTASKPRKKNKQHGDHEELAPCPSDDEENVAPGLDMGGAMEGLVSGLQAVRIVRRASGAKGAAAVRRPEQKAQAQASLHLVPPSVFAYAKDCAVTAVVHASFSSLGLPGTGIRTSSLPWEKVVSANGAQMAVSLTQQPDVPALTPTTAKLRRSRRASLELKFGAAAAQCLDHMLSSSSLPKECLLHQSAHLPQLPVASTGDAELAKSAYAPSPDSDSEDWPAFTAQQEALPSNTACGVQGLDKEASVEDFCIISSMNDASSKHVVSGGLLQPAPSSKAQNRRAAAAASQQDLHSAATGVEQGQKIEWQQQEPWAVQASVLQAVDECEPVTPGHVRLGVDWVGAGVQQPCQRGADQGVESEPGVGFALLASCPDSAAPPSTARHGLRCYGKAGYYSGASSTGGRTPASVLRPPQRQRVRAPTPAGPLLGRCHGSEDEDVGLEEQELEEELGMRPESAALPAGRPAVGFPSKANVLAGAPTPRDPLLGPSRVALVSAEQRRRALGCAALCPTELVAALGRRGYSVNSLHLHDHLLTSYTAAGPGTPMTDATPRRRTTHSSCFSSRRQTGEGLEADADPLSHLMCDEVDFFTPVQSPKGRGRSALSWHEAGGDLLAASALRRAHSMGSTRVSDPDGLGCGGHPGPSDSLLTSHGLPGKSLPDMSGLSAQQGVTPCLHGLPASCFSSHAPSSGLSFHPRGAETSATWEYSHLGHSHPEGSSCDRRQGTLLLDARGQEAEYSEGEEQWCVRAPGSGPAGTRQGGGWGCGGAQDDDTSAWLPLGSLTTLEEFNGQLSKAAERGDRGRAERVWCEMKERSDVLPDLRTLNMLMRCLCKTPVCPDEAEDLMAEVCMLGGVQPNATTHILLAEIGMRFEQLSSVRLLRLAGEGVLGPGSEAAWLPGCCMGPVGACVVPLLGTT